MEERSTRPADHMGIRQRRRLPEIAEITQDGLAFEPLCQRRLASSAQLSMPPPRGSNCAQYAQDTCLHGEALHPERQTGTRPGPVRGTPKGPHPSVTKPEAHFHFPTANWTAETDKGPTPPRFPRTSCSQCRSGFKIGKVYRQPQPDRSNLCHIINNLSDVLDRQKNAPTATFQAQKSEFPAFRAMQRYGLAWETKAQYLLTA